MAKNSAVWDLTKDFFAVVHMDRTRTFTTVQLSSGDWSGLGVAKRHPNDKHNAQAALDLATARALRDIADDMETQARRRMR